MLKCEDVSVVFHANTQLEKVALHDLNLEIHDGDFVTILGNNGAGKSTFFNTITGSVIPTSGRIFLDGQDITNQKEHIRARKIGRLFQNPEHGTSPHLTVEENLALAYAQGGLLSQAVFKKHRDFFQDKLATLDMGLEDRLKTPMGLLSGGQRQAVALMMALIHPPKLLLLDEHTAALDPKSAKKILDVTNQMIESDKITALMITHNIKDALENGNRLLVFKDGNVFKDLDAISKSKLKPADILDYYEV